MRSETSDRVPAKKLLLTLSTPLVCFMVFHVFLPLNRLPTTAFSCRPPLVRCCRESADAHKHFVENTFNSIGLFTLPLNHSFSGEIELTENQCQSVSMFYVCSTVHRRRGAGRGGCVATGGAGRWMCGRPGGAVRRCGGFVWM